MKKILLSVVVLAMVIPAVASAFRASNFQNPYGVVVDLKTNFIYVSNVNGDLNSRDGDGFISRLKGDGTVDQFRFIDGAKKDITLHAPKGMAIISSALYVADIDKLRVFDVDQAKHVYDINFGELPVQHFYDVTVGPDGALYVTDGPGNAIYRVDAARRHEVTLFTSGPKLGQPHGLCWLSARQIFVVAGWSTGQVTALDRKGQRQPIPSIFLRTLGGIAADDFGNAYVASTALRAVFRIAPNFALFDFLLGQESPMGVAYHVAEKSLIVASFDTGTVQSFPVEAATK